MKITPIIEKIEKEVQSSLSSNGSLTQEELLNRISIPRKKLEVALLSLEQKGIIKREFPGMRTLYCLTRTKFEGGNKYGI